MVETRSSLFRLSYKTIIVLVAALSDSLTESRLTGLFSFWPIRCFPAKPAWKVPMLMYFCDVTVLMSPIKEELPKDLTQR